MKKETLGELKARIEVLSVQLEMSIAAERAWETSMMRACGEDGPKSVADKFAALEARCAALAAENAGLKSAHPQPFGPEMMKALDAYEKHQDDVPETGMLDAFFILRDSILVDTTYTDAFLTEVRAQGACLIIDYHNERADALRDIDRNGAFRHESAALDAIDVLMKIRKGVQS